MSVLAAIFLLVAVCECYGQSADPIVNGQDADPEEYPWQVALLYKNRVRCGGSLISRTVVLTAAHCVEDDPKQKRGRFSVVVGSTDLANPTASTQTIKALKGRQGVLMHPDYNTNTLNNDVALIFLSTSVVLDETVALVDLAEDDTFDAAALTSDDVWVSGWGDTSDKTDIYPDVLQELQTNVISNKKCNKKMRKYGYKATAKMLCTLNKKAGVCYGDSGGPLGYYDGNGDFIQVGIVSWGPTRKCASGIQVFARVSKFYDWIIDNLV